MIRTEHRQATIPDLLARENDMYLDHPLMGKHNNELIPIILLLNQEISELNGHTEDGMALEQYRQQETADIGWFIFAIVRQQRLPLDYGAIREEAQYLLDGYEVENVDGWGESQEMVYESLKFHLQLHAQKLLAASEQPSHMTEIISQVLRYTWALFFLYGTTLEAAMLEKHARNLAKHKGTWYRTLGTYEEAAGVAGKEWRDIHGNEQFYETGRYRPVEGPLLTAKQRARTANRENALQPPLITPEQVEHAKVNARLGKELTDSLSERMSTTAEVALR